MGQHTPSRVRQVFQNERIRTNIFNHLHQQDIIALRRTSSRMRKILTPIVFQKLTVNFRALTFRSNRLAALGRIGQYIETLQFVFPHSELTYMPPMLDPESQALVSLIYEPFSRQGESNSRRYPFGNSRIDSLLLYNYGIVLLAALDTPRFTRALMVMKNLSTLIVSCPGTPIGEPSQRCVIDYALLSLRVAMERSGLRGLKSIVLDPLHLSGIQYLLPGVLAVGNALNSPQTWGNVTRLTMKISAWKELANASSAKYRTQLKFLYRFLEYFSNIEELTFSWTGEARSICPLTLDLIKIPSRSPRGPISSPGYKPIVGRSLYFPKLGKLRLENIGMDAIDLSIFLSQHTKHFNEWSLEDVYFTKGTLEQALQPLKIIQEHRGIISGDDEEVSFADLLEELSFCSLEMIGYDG